MKKIKKVKPTKKDLTPLFFGAWLHTEFDTLIHIESIEMSDNVLMAKVTAGEGSTILVPLFTILVLRKLETIVYIGEV